MVRYSLGSNYTPNYNQVSRIRQFCNNHPGTPGCQELPNNLYVFTMKDYNVNIAMDNPTIDLSYNTTILEFNVNENNLDITDVSITSSLVPKALFTWNYNKLMSILTIYLDSSIAYCNIYATGIRQLTQGKTLTINFSKTFSNITS